MIKYSLNFSHAFYSVLNYKIDNALFVANAKGNSQVTVFGDCISNYTNPFSTKFDARKSAEKHDESIEKQT